MLLQESIKINAYGFSQKSLGILKVSSGESIHCYEHEIMSIKSYKRDHTINCCYGVYEYLDIEYKEKGLIENNKLPAWISNIDIIDGVIMLSGIP